MAGFDWGSIAAQTGGSFLSGVSNLIGSRKQYKRQLNLQQREFDNNLQMWNMQNEYNSPASQMQRYQEAGLNPRLIYGDSGNSGNASSSPSYSAPNAPNYGSAFGDSSLVAMQAIGDLLQRQENLKSQRLDNAMKQVDLENYVDSEDQISDPFSLDDNGNPVVTISRRPGLGSLKRSRAVEELRNLSNRNWSFEEQDIPYLWERNRQQYEGFNVDQALKRSQTQDTLQRRLNRILEGKLLDMEYRWYNSSKFMKNIAPILNLLNRRRR